MRLLILRCQMLSPLLIRLASLGLCRVITPQRRWRLALQKRLKRMARMERREKLLAKLRALPIEARSRMKQALAQGADEITDMQRRLVPKHTGKLMASITQTWGDKPKQSSAGLAGGGSTVGDPDLTVWITAGGGGRDTGWYARFVEFGTSPHTNRGAFPGTQNPGTAPQPFFFPAYRTLKGRVKSRITRAITKAAKEVASRD